ncbi:MAG: UDP-N-acetylglucosamine 1-carboxyvinyltransferase [bacterium]|nr:UDP-N-acetylglucosamine 1-carboxyvinyltransferase [bacterium]
MSQYIIQGGNKLKGKVKLSGNKNSILPCLAATLLTDKDVLIKNVPQIADVELFLEILRSLGAEVEVFDHQVRVNAGKANRRKLPDELSRKLRASILFVGPLLARLGKVEFPHPGGCVIGRRSIEAHLGGFSELGFKLRGKNGGYEASGFISKKEEEVFLDEPSVTVTENLLLTAALGSSKVTLKNCAAEPHVVDLCRMLSMMGVGIEGVGTSTLKIRSSANLKGGEFTISSDYVEFGTYAIAAAITSGEIEIEGLPLKGMEPVVHPLEKMGLEFKEQGNAVGVTAKHIKPIQVLKTNIWPGFPTDMMSLAIVLATQARGVSLMHDWMYESRMFFTDKLISMGANITIADPHRVLISGPATLRRRELESPDIRAGMALVMAALIAKGESIINRAELIERGYEDVVGKLSALGAVIEKVS